MLTPADETFLHQAPMTMSETITSDHRFYDRCILSVVNPAGGAHLFMSMGIYKNMNAADGFALFSRGNSEHSVQHNVRVSRKLRPHFETEIEGLRYEVVAPMHEIRIALDAARHPLGFDLRWTSTAPPVLEDTWWGTRRTVNERVVTDVRRFAQVGTVNGWISVEGERVEVQQWFCVRDKSWGVRGGVGGFEPFTGSQVTDGGRTFSEGTQGLLINWFCFATDELSGYLGRTEDDTGADKALDGIIRFNDGVRPDLKVTSASIKVEFPKNSRYYTFAELNFTTDDGTAWTMAIDPLVPSVLLKGGGYDRGWSDGLGLGVHRGSKVEHDIYEQDTASSRSRVLPGSGEISHNQREQMAKITLNGKPGFADCIIIATGKLPNFGIDQ